MLSRFLQKKGELTKKTLEGVVHEALEKELFPTITHRTVIDLNGKSIVTCTISHRDIIDKVMQLTDGIPSTNLNEQAFYSTEYSRITHKRILKICRERFSGEPDTIGRGEEKERALTFDKEVVQKVGRIFEIISEIKILEPASSHREEQEEVEGQGEIDWGIPTPGPSPSQDRPQKEEQNHAQNEQVGTEERKYNNYEDNRENNNKERSLKYLAERERKVKCDINDSYPSSSDSGQISVPSSPFSCYHNGCDFSTEDESEYRRHWPQKHTGVPILYPTKFEIEKYGLKPQGKKWEI